MPLGPLRHAQWAARAKAEAVAARFPRHLVLAADTVVALGRHRLGKPRDSSEARQMLKALSGRTHVVYTAVHALEAGAGRSAAGFSRTRVRMKRLSTKEINSYVRSAEPRDKAGAYAIQGRGGRLVASIAGPFDNVVGLPLHIVRRLLRSFGLEVA
jgi:septum formation protein